jgi:hypothetical protein
MATIDEAISDVEAVFRQFGDAGRVFIRPLGLEKTFTGRCVGVGEYVSALESARYSRCGVLITRPRPLGAEWRLVVGPCGAIASSGYRKGGALDIEPGCPGEVLTYAEQVLTATDYRPDALFMLDVCESAGSLYVLELNSFSCSGLYACDPDAVVAAATREAITSWERSQCDEPHRP